MRTTLVWKITVLSVLLVLAAGMVMAQNQRVGTTGASWLLIPVGARDMSLGGSSIATSEGVEALYWNPAGLSRLAHSAEGMFSSLGYIADINVAYGGVAGKLGDFGNIGVTVKSLSFGDIPLTTEEDPEGITGRIYSPTFVAVGFSYARSLTDNIGVGTQIKVITENIDQVSSSGFAFDFGIQYKSLLGVKGVSMGLTMKNIGPQMKYDGPGLYRTAVASDGSRPQQKYKLEAASFELPAVIEMGLSYEGTSDNFFYGLSGAFANDNFYYDQFRFGGEVGFTMEAVKIFGRAGYNALAQYNDQSIFGTCFGFGLSYAATGVDITVDYGYRSVKYFSANNVFSVKFGF